MVKDTPEGVQPFDALGALDRRAGKATRQYKRGKGCQIVHVCQQGKLELAMEHTRRSSANHMSLILYKCVEESVSAFRVGEKVVRSAEGTKAIMDNTHAWVG